MKPWETIDAFVEAQAVRIGAPTSGQTDGPGGAVPDLRGAVLGGEGPAGDAGQGSAGVLSDGAAVVAQAPPAVR
jgi:hypothetical protein